ncbi:MAG: hypothetical protein JW818_19130 [Pirellulales bacterium]|nr:hypothetical protein [Pirellulales bacterium]
MLHRAIPAFLALLGLLPVGNLGAEEVIRLPAVMTPSEPYPVQLASHPETIVELRTPSWEEDPENIWNRPIDARKGFFQEAFVDATWFARGAKPRDFGDTQLSFQSRFALPLPTKRHPLILTPGFAVHYLDGPTQVDLPPRLFDTYLQFRWLHKLSPRWSADLSVTPGVFSDFEQSTDNALRITGHFGAMWDWTPKFKVAMGVAYLDREDYRILPIAGFIWEPNDDTEFEIMVPRPKIARRIYWPGAMDDHVQDWLYLAGELGGGSWAVRRDSGANDVVTYRDFRLILGLERRVLYGIDYRLELAYLFGRKLDFRSPTPRLYPTDTVMLRLGATY